MEEDRFNENLSRWSHFHPKAAIFLPYTDCSALSFCKTDTGEINLKDATHNFYLHSQSGALQESKQWFSKLDLSGIEILYVFGVGLGYDYEAARKWLEKNPRNRLVFLEDNLAVLHRLFETEMGTKILNDKQVALFYFDDLESPKSPLSEIYWNFMSIKMTVSALRSYAKNYQDRYSQLEHKLIYDATMRFAVVDEYLNYGSVFFRSFYANMLKLNGAYLGNGLFGKFTGIPAIICGAGPSLMQHFDLLRNIQDKALIFAGGSAINALNSADIQPHFGAGIDPNAEQSERYKKNTAFEVPFLYRNRLFHDAFKIVHGPRLYITGSGGYDIARWFEEKFEIATNPEGEDLDEGFNIANFCIAIAHALGCDPIICVGMDLAFTEMHVYSKGVIEKTAVTKKQILEGLDLDSTAIMRPDIFGNQVYTLWKWIEESYWISSFAKNNPNMTFINATEGGIGFPGIPNVPLAETIKTYLTRNYDLVSRLHCEIQNNAMPQITADGLVEAEKELRDSLVRSQAHLQVLLEETNSVIEQIKKNKIVPSTLQSGKAALSEIELSEEPGYNYVLEVFNIVYSKILNAELQSLQAAHEQPEWQTTMDKLALNCRRLTFLHNVAAANVAFIEQALEQV